MVTAYKFIASFTQILINYDYNVLIYTPYVFNGISLVSCRLIDQTAEVSIFESTPKEVYGFLTPTHNSFLAALRKLST